MNAKTVTTVSRLKIGDRFYKLNDRSKQVYQRIPGAIKRTKYRSYIYWCLADNSSVKQALFGKTKVVFLRSVAPAT